MNYFVIFALFLFGLQPGLAGQQTSLVFKDGKWVVEKLNDKSSKFPDTFIVRESDAVPNESVNAILEDKNKHTQYYVTAVGCMLHCQVVRTGEELSGKYRWGNQIYVDYDLGNGKHTTIKYRIEREIH